MTQNDEERRGKTQRVMETRADTQNEAERLIQRRFPFLVGQVERPVPDDGKRLCRAVRFVLLLYTGGSLRGGGPDRNRDGRPGLPKIFPFSTIFQYFF